MQCLTTYQLVLTVLGTCALTAVVHHVSPIPRVWNSPPRSTASSAAVRLGSADPACNYGIQPYYFLPADPAVPWNVTPKAWDLRAFDARCQPRPLVDRLLDVRHRANSSRKLSIILYGDR